MFFREWEELKRHSHGVTVWDAVRLDVLRGELQDMADAVPTADDIKAAPKPIRAAFSAIIQLLRQFPKRRALVKEIKRIGKDLKPPAELIRPHYQAGDEDPRKIPGVTWYAYLVDLFAHEYGWREADVRALPYAALSEFILAIEVRRVAESSRRVVESHPTEKGLDELNKYPRRKMEIPRHVLLEYFANNRAKLWKDLGGPSNVH